METNDQKETTLQTEEQEIDVEIEETQDDDAQDEGEKVVEKPKETPDAKRARLKRQLEQHDKKFGFKNEPEVKTESKSQQGELDKGDKALLVAYGIKGVDEFALARNFMARTGDDIDSLVTDDIFQAKLKNLREARDTKNALPSGSKKAPTTVKDSVDYHLQKYEQTGELPSDFSMRSAVLNAKVGKQKDSPFG